MKSTDQLLSEFGEDIVWHEHDKPKGSGDRSAGKALKQAQSPAKAWDKQAAAVRSHVNGVVRDSPQVMVKITGSNADMQGFARSVDYVARGGKYKKKGEPELELENENGDRFVGPDGRELLRREWAFGGPPIPEVVEEAGLKEGGKPRRQVLKIIYSMPAHVGREAVSAAAKASVAQTFKNHQWAIAHHADTDNQHTHVLVKMVDMDGKRMDPRKADLEIWRKVFAKELNARGIEAVATRRRVRLKRVKGVSQAVRELRDRGEVPNRDKTRASQPQAVSRALENEQRVLKAYTGIASALADSKDPKDRALGQQLQNKLAQQGHAISSRMSPATPKPSL